jgi:hypothetical protein
MQKNSTKKVKISFEKLEPKQAPTAVWGSGGGPG